MIVWSSPLWLTGLLIIPPALWWLHRFRRTGPEILVSCLLLWPTQKKSGETGSRTASADKIWLLRAFIGSALALALAGPGWLTVGQPPVHVWLDDSLSMGTVEEGGKNRLDSALQQLLAALDERRFPQVEVSSLTKPARPILHLSGEIRGQWAAKLASWIKLTDQEPQPPATLLMPAGTEHWVVSDGADDTLNDWIGVAPISRVFLSGRETENSVIGFVSVRPAPNRANAWLGLVQVANRGLQPTKRKLTLFGAGQTLGDWEIDLPAGETRQIEFVLPVASGREIIARLSPRDALSLDDELTLSLPNKISTRIIGNCNPYVMAALQTHPRIAFGEEAELAIVCGESTPPEKGAVVWLHQAETAKKPESPVLWLDRAEKLRGLFLKTEWLNVYKSDIGSSQPLLVAGSTPLVTLKVYPRPRVDCYLDVSQPEFVRQPEFPALIAGLLNTALADDLLDGINNQSRPAKGSQILPQALPGSFKADAMWKATEVQQADLSSDLILLLLPALLLDFWLSGGRTKTYRAGK